MYWNKRGKACLYTLCWDLKIIPYVLAKILQNGAKFIQKTVSCFKKSYEEFGQPQTTRSRVESPKSWNLMGYFCPRNTFIQLKHIQRIYPTLLSTSCVKIHQMTYVIFETICHFSRHSPSIYQTENFQTCHCSH